MKRWREKKELFAIVIKFISQKDLREFAFALAGSSESTSPAQVRYETALFLGEQIWRTIGGDDFRTKDRTAHPVRGEISVCDA